MSTPNSSRSLALPPSRALVVMGVSGCGKTDTSLGAARCLGYRHIEADHFHPAENVERMRAGIPLSDQDRIQWLDRLIEEIRRAQQDGEGFVLACSALRRSYRERLRRAVPELRFAHLVVDYETALQRVGGRAGHFMPTSLVDSQFATLEPPEGEPGVLSVDATRPTDEVVRTICDWMLTQTPGAGVQARVRHAAGAGPAAEDENASEQAPSLGNPPIYTGPLARLFDRLTDGLMALLMAVMVIAVFGNVVGRYLFNAGWAGAEELSRLAFVWLVFVGVASSLRRGELMSFTMLRDGLRGALRKLVDSLSWLLVCVACALCAWGGWQQVAYGWGNKSPVLAYPVVLAMVPVLLGMVALGVLALVQLVSLWRAQPPAARAAANITAD
ncbi:gluconokinase, GntK/IdnK-type [Stutzerimonas azotifigens]|uniref:gluconokinase, GntK/IdnK-type n=1 Tax=Stutzerimonas azotifigens TaxID=291995 RepID=UPI00041091E6|nr:gluconokinase, GntK/IdnK-type [Stutzerimonas azotifigens]